MRFEVPSALDYFAALVADDLSFPLTEAALSVAQEEFPDLDIAAMLDEIDLLAERLRRRLNADCPPVQRLRLLNRYFFQELGFAGNVNDYYDAGNSCLNVVLQSRRGIPISLAVLYLELAGQVGLKAHGVSFPGHFLVKLPLPQGEVVIDPFNGVSLSREALEERLQPYRRREGLTGEFDVPLSQFLRAASGREMIARMLRNLKEIYRETQDWARLVGVTRRLVLLLPQSLEELRDRGLALAECGRLDEAIEDLQAYVDRGVHAVDRYAVADRLAGLRADGRPRLH